MSLPKELMDQLLSGYLDDALSADERVRVEQLLKSNAEVAEELEQLRVIRRSLKAISRMGSEIKLDQGFADRVLGAAIARAHEEGLDEDHPLVRLSEQPSTTPSPAPPLHSRWPIAAAMVGLAATILLAVLLLRPGQEPTPRGDSLARVNAESMEVEAVPYLRDSVDEPDSVIEPGPMLVEDNGPDAHDVAINEGTAESSVATNGDSVTTKPDSAIPVDGASVPAASIAASNAAPEEHRAEPMDKDAPTVQMGAILVVEVVRSESGRESDAIGKAMQAADITAASRKEISEPITGFVGDDVNDRLEGASVIYLDLPGKQFDLLYQSLWADEEGIQSVRMTLAMSAPLLEVVNAVRPDPTTVRHEAAAYELFSQSGAVDQLASELSQLPFPDFDRSRAATTMLSSGPDIQTQVLLLIR